MGSFRSDTSPRPAGPRHRRRLVAAGLAVLLAGGGLVAATAAPGSAAGLAPSHYRPFSHRLSVAPAGSVPSTTWCKRTWDITCYDPSQIRAAYDMGPAYAAGFTGGRRTIVIADAFGSPTLVGDTKRFSRDFGLPVPDIKVVTPNGPPPATDPDNAAGWAGETTLDVQWAHAMAPDAAIVVVIASDDDADLASAMDKYLSKGTADVLSQSFGDTEQNIDSSTMASLVKPYQTAARKGTSVMASTGDWGAANPDLDFVFYPFPTVEFPASEPSNLAVGGTHLQLDNKGRRLAPDDVWNESSLDYGPLASGGGLSSVFARPAYQAGTGVPRASRATPDVSLTAAGDGGVLVYLTSELWGTGYQVFGGTSVAAPIMAGITADAIDAAGHRLGAIHDSVYRLAASDSPAIVDITQGTNTVSFLQGDPPAVVTVTGQDAKRGYDTSSGVGTVDGSRLIRALAHLS